MAAAQKATRLTGQMLACSGTRPACSKPVELSSLLEENESLLREVVSPPGPAHPGGTEAPSSGDGGRFPDPPDRPHPRDQRCGGDRRQSGVVNVRCYERYLRGDDLAKSLIEATPREGWYVLLEVEDTGCGMSPEIQNRLLDPFFTTKFFGRGLGLPAAMGIIAGTRGRFSWTASWTGAPWSRCFSLWLGTGSRSNRMTSVLRCNTRLPSIVKLQKPLPPPSTKTPRIHQGLPTDHGFAPG